MQDQKQSEAEYLAQYKIHDFDVPLTSVDVVIFTIKDEVLHALIVKRGAHPFMGKWSLPGGFIQVHQDKTLVDAARRILQEKTGVSTPYLEQLQGFGSQTRDPRGWSSTFVYFALISSDRIALNHGGNAKAARWLPLDGQAALPKLAFDHSEILSLALTRLRNKVEYTSLAAHLLPTEFTLTDLQKVYQIILGRQVDKSAFRKRIKDGDFLLELKDRWRLGSNRPAQLYSLRSDRETVFFNRLITGDTGIKGAE